MWPFFDLLCFGTEVHLWFVKSRRREFAGADDGETTGEIALKIAGNNAGRGTVGEISWNMEYRDIFAQETMCKFRIFRSWVPSRSFGVLIILDRKRIFIR